MTLSTLPMSQAVRTPRVSPCEPLCARFGAGVALYPPWGYFARTGRTSRRHKNGEYAAVTHGRPAFQRHEAHVEGSDTTPHTEMPKMQNGSLITSPNRAPCRNPAKWFRWEEDERQRERVLPLAAGRGIRRPLGRRPASHLSGLRRSRCPAKRTGRGMAPHPQAAGRSPHPLLATIGEKHEKRYQIQHAHGVR